MIAIGARSSRASPQSARSAKPKICRRSSAETLFVSVDGIPTDGPSLTESNSSDASAFSIVLAEIGWLFWCRGGRKKAERVETLYAPQTKKSLAAPEL